MSLILNVDDNEIGRYAKTRTLQRAGFEVIEAATGAEGLALAESRSPALVLLDVKLPDIDGIVVCSMLKDRDPTLPIIQISATFVGLEDRIRGLDNGADGYLTQPLEPQELVSNVRALLRLRSAEGELRQLNAELEQRVATAIAEREAVEDRLRQSQKMEAVGQLTGGIAHDFNNLLTVVVGSLDLLAKGGLDKRSERLVMAAMEAGQRGVKLTSQLLAFSRIQSLRAEPVALHDAIDNMQELIVRSLGPEARLAFDLKGVEACVAVDLNQLEMAVLNLAINARDASGDAAEITVGLSDNLQHPALGSHPLGYIGVTVADKGVGMTADTLSRAFDPFFTTKGVGKGTGLGLSQVFGFARQSGGAVYIDSTLGQGTTVTLALPRAADADCRASAAPLPDRLAEGSGHLVLVVDDDDAVRAVLVESLAALGYQTREATSASEALGVLRELCPDVLLADFAMPDVTGAELATEARRIYPHLPIVIASGFANTAAIEAAVGDVPVLRKPFRMPELAAALQAVMASERSMGQ